MEDDTSLFLLFRVARDGWHMMKYFSHRHTVSYIYWRCCYRGLLYNFLVDFVVNVSLSCHTCLLSIVACFFFTLVNEVLLSANLAWNVFDVRPTYVWSRLLSLVFTVAWYTIDLARYWSSVGVV